MADDPRLTGRRRYDLPVANFDDPGWFPDYRVVAMNASHVAGMHRRYLADIRGEYQAAAFASRWKRLATVALVASNLILAVVAVVALVK